MKAVTFKKLGRKLLQGVSLAALALYMCAFSVAEADSITNLRAYANQDKTRVVFDLDFNPHYSTALNDGGKTFIIRVNDVTNAKNAKSTLTFDPRCAVKKLQKRLDKSDVRYLFTLEGSGTPNVFVLKPQSGHNYRLVIDFPHTSTGAWVSKGELKVLDQETAAALSGTGAGAGGMPPTHVITVEDADHAEKELLNSLSTVGADGIRTMTPAQAAQYQKQLQALREKEAENNQHVEEEVLETQAPPPAQIIAARPDPFIIAIDAGHGGKDPGAIGKRGVKEKNVTLSIARYLADYINSNPQFRGRLVRSRDVFVDLDRRSEIARAYKANILISVHADSVASGNSARGASVWVLNNNRAQRENSKVLKQKDTTRLLGGAGEVLSQSEQNPYLAATILEMTSVNARSEGYTLGEEILQRLGRFTRLHNSKPIPASLAVLKSPDIPSLLIETGFLSNRYEEIQLNQPNYQKQLAYCIYQGIKNYYEKNPALMFKTRQESALRSGVPEKVHTVKKGEYLAKIASGYGVTVAALKQRNALKSDVLAIGQKLVIPH